MKIIKRYLIFWQYLINLGWLLKQTSSFNIFQNGVETSSHNWDWQSNVVYCKTHLRYLPVIQVFRIVWPFANGYHHPVKLFYQYEKYGGVERSKKKRSIPRALFFTVFAVPPYLLTKRNLQVSANLFLPQTETFSEISPMKTGCWRYRGDTSFRTNCEVLVRIEFAEMRSHEVVN